MKILKYLILFATLAMFSCSSPKEKSTTEEKPNIILIVVDDQGYADFTGFEGHDSAVKNPNISNLAKSGVAFTQAYTTAPVCSPSRVGILTGKNQFRWDMPASWGPGLPDSVKTIAEVLQKQGYATARIGKNDLGRNFHNHDVREYPLKHGYDEFLGFCAHAHDYWLLSDEIKNITEDPSGTSAVLGPLMHNEGMKEYKEGYLTDILTNEAIDYIKIKRDKPFFLTLSYNSVHHLIHEVPQKYLDMYDVENIENYHPDNKVEFGNHKPGSYLAYYDKYSRLGAIDDENMRKYYLANLHCLDDNIGNFMKALDSEDLRKNTMIIFISDNGGSPLTGANNYPLTAGKYSLWEGGIRVPMSISWEGKIDPNQIRNDYVSATDIFPTISKIVGHPNTDKTIDGRDLFLEEDPDRFLVWKWQKTWAVRKGDWKLTNSNENSWKGEPSSRYQKPIRDDLSLKLFNIKDDPGERNDLAMSNPEMVNKLKSEYESWCTENIGKF